MMEYWIVGVAIIVMGYCLFVIINVHQSAKEIQEYIEKYDSGIRQIIELQMEILNKEK